MHVRTATRDDRDRVANVHRSAVRGVEPGPETYSPERLAAWDHERDPGDYPVDDGNRSLVVAERRGTVVGFGQADHAAGEVAAVYVDPAAAGRGVGSALLANLEGRLAGRHPTVELLSSNNAVGFYEAAGYEAVETTTVTASDRSYECVRMRKRLAPGRPAFGRLPA